MVKTEKHTAAGKVPDNAAGPKLRDQRTKRIWIVATLTLVALVLLLLTYRIVVRRALQALDSSEKTSATLPVKVTTIQPADIVLSVQHSGVMQAWQKAIILSEVAGTVESISAKVGDSLEPGSPILKIDDEMLHYTVEQAKANVLQLEANHETSLRELKRKRSLFKNKVISDFEFDIARAKEKADRAMLDSAKAQLKIAERDLRETLITSPIRGILASRTVDIGTNVGRGTQIATVVDIERIKIRIGISEKAIGDIREGLPVKIETDAYPGTVYTGSIYSVGTKADDLTLTFPVEVVIVNSREPVLKPGMVARVIIETGTHRNAIALPQEAVLRRAGRSFVWTVENETARSKTVITLDVIGSRIIIKSGLSAGDLVVIAGQDRLEDNSPVTIIQ